MLRGQGESALGELFFVWLMGMLHFSPSHIPKHVTHYYMPQDLLPPLHIPVWRRVENVPLIEEHLCILYHI